MKREKKKSEDIKIDMDNTQAYLDKNKKSQRKSELSQQEFIISWQAPEFEYQQKDVSWYWLSLITAIIVLVFAIWQKNFFFAIFVLIAWFVIIYLAGRFPTIWEFKIDEKGIKISLPNNQTGNNKFFLYSEIEGFDIHQAGEECKELVLKLKSKFSPYFKINFYIRDEEKVKNLLLKFLPQEEYQPSLVDSVSRLIRF